MDSSLLISYVGSTNDFLMANTMTIKTGTPTKKTTYAKGGGCITVISTESLTATLSSLHPVDA